MLGYGDPVCWDHPNAIHNERCPEARRLARQRHREALMMHLLMTGAWVIIGAVVLRSIWVKTCGLGIAAIIVT